MKIPSRVKRIANRPLPESRQTSASDNSLHLKPAQLARHRARDIKLKITTKNPTCLSSGKRNTM